MTAILNGKCGPAAPAALARSRDLVQPALRAAVERLDPQLRPVVGYHLGWCDEDGRPVDSNGGKAVRPALAMLAAEATGGTAAAAVPGAVAVELVHNFSLVHDDLMDRDLARRHRRTVWALWGDATAVLAGDAMLALAHEVLTEAESPHAAAAGAVVAAATRELIRGQVQDMAFERRDDVSLAECEQMAAGKTGALMSASAAVGAVLAGAPADQVDAMTQFGAQVGLAFQLVDDLLGIWGEPDVTGKPVHSDLRARKKSLPITWAAEHCHADPAAGRELADWLRRPSSLHRADGGPECSDADLRHVAALVERSGAREWATGEASRRVELAERALAGIPAAEEPAGESADTAAAALVELSRLAHFIVDRQA